MVSALKNTRAFMERGKYLNVFLRVKGIREQYRSAITLLSARGSSSDKVPTSRILLAATGSLFLAGMTSETCDGKKLRNIVDWASKTWSETIVTKMDYLEHDPRDYDVYIRNPTAEDLPYLLKEFDEHGKEVWPWVWTHPNETGPHFVFVGVGADTISHIRMLRLMSPAYNILLIASHDALQKAAEKANDPHVYEETHCGVVTDASLALLNAEAKILMLSDERVIAFDTLIIR